MNKDIKRTTRYPSSSDPAKSYAVLQYADNSTSCNCPAWTRRVADDGSRECKHTKKLKEQYPEAKSRTEPYRNGGRGTVAVTVPKNVPVTIRVTAGTRVTVSSVSEKPSAAQKVSRKFNWED